MIVLGKDKTLDNYFIDENGVITDLKGKIQHLVLHRGRYVFKHISVHQIQMWTNYGWRDGKIWVIHHKDENKLNNNLDNLEWCTYQYNNTYGTVMARKQNTKNKSNSRGAEKAILQYDTDMNLIKEHKSIRSCGYDARNVVNALKGKIKKAYGYIWKYKNVD